MVPDDDTLRAILDGLRHGDVRITADRCTGDSRAVSAFCDLVRVAPAIAAEVLRLRGMLRAASGALAATRVDLSEMQARAEKAEAERDALTARVAAIRATIGKCLDDSYHYRGLQRETTLIQAVPRWDRFPVESTMADPIPLAAPDGTVYAYACGRCHRVAGGTHVPGPVSPVDRLAELSLHRATRCCVCQCGAAMSPTSRWRACDACSAAHDARLAAQREAARAALAARGVRECDVCFSDDSDGPCSACGGTGEVPL